MTYGKITGACAGAPRASTAETYGWGADPVAGGGRQRPKRPPKPRAIC